MNECGECSERAELRKEMQLGRRSGQRERSGPTGAQSVQEVLYVQSSSSLQPSRGPWWCRLSPAARGNRPEQISPRSHGEAPGAAADAAWGRHRTRIPSGRSRGPRRAARGAAGGPGELPPLGTALKAGLRVGSRAGAVPGELQPVGSPLRSVQERRSP